MFNTFSSFPPGPAEDQPGQIMSEALAELLHADAIQQLEVALLDSQ